MKLFDTHAHLDGFAAEGTVEAVLARAQAAGVACICAVGSSEASNELVVRLAGEYPEMLLAAVRSVEVAALAAATFANARRVYQVEGCR